MPSRPVVQDFYPESFALCYGCGRHSEHGLHLQSVWEGDDVVARFTPRPEDISVPGFVYGGLVASLIDCHGMATAAAEAETCRRPGTRVKGDGAVRHRRPPCRLSPPDSARG